MIKIIVYTPNKEPEERTVSPMSLSDMQDLVGGYIETVSLSGLVLDPTIDPMLYIFVDEEGKLKNKPVTRVTPQDFLVGDFFVARIDDAGDFVSLSDADVSAIRAALK